MSVKERERRRRLERAHERERESNRKCEKEREREEDPGVRASDRQTDKEARTQIEKDVSGGKISSSNSFK